MSNTKMFSKYIIQLAEYQNQLLPDNKLEKDYMIIYDYIMDLLQKDATVGKVLVRKKQQMSNINSDILLDLTKLLDARGYLYESYLCLTLTGRDNKRFTNVKHPFCNEKQGLVPRNIKNSIWLALHRGLLTLGSFVCGYQDDIYEISLCSNDPYEGYIRLNANSDDIDLKINLRVLINYIRNPYNESLSSKPYPAHELNKKWFATLPKDFLAPFEVCLPKLEHEIKQKCFKLVLILRLYRFLFKKHQQLCLFDAGFLDSIIYSEYMKNIRVLKPTLSQRLNYIFSDVFTHIYNALNTKNFPCFWNERLNLIKSVDKNSLFSKASHEFFVLNRKFKSIKNSESLQYDEFLEFFDFEMDTFSYEVDQFGIFKSY